MRRPQLGRRLGAAFVLTAALLAGVAGCGVLPGIGSPGTGPSAPPGNGRKLAAVSQQLNYGQQPGWTWQSVPPGKGCTRVSATVTGLSSQVAYVFVVHALLRKYESLPPTAPEVARSEAVMMR